MKRVMMVLGGFIMGAVVSGVFIKKADRTVMESIDRSRKKFRKYYDVLNRWIDLQHQGKSIAEYLEKRGYHNIVIYGMGEVGSRLYEELMETNIGVLYAIDKNPVGAYNELNIIGTVIGNEQADAVIVTPVFDFDSIKDELVKSFCCEIISLEDVIFEI